MKRTRFSLLDLVVALCCIAVACGFFRSLRNSAGSNFYARLGRHPGRTLWPSNAGAFESLALIMLIALLIYMPVNAIVRRPNGSIFKIQPRYYLAWFGAFAIYVGWSVLRSTP